MLDDEFQLPILEARYLADSTVPADRRRAFLLEAQDGGPTRLALMLRELALVAAETRPYARDPKAINLISFVKRDSTHWRSASWRDSDAGYANGRFAMDINAIWAPRALEAIAAIRTALLRHRHRPGGARLARPGDRAGTVGGVPGGLDLASPRDRHLERRPAAFRRDDPARGDRAASRGQAGPASRPGARLLAEGDGRAGRGPRLARVPRPVTGFGGPADPGRQHRPRDRAVPRRHVGARGGTRRGRAVSPPVSRGPVRGAARPASPPTMPTPRGVYGIPLRRTPTIRRGSSGGGR